MKKRLTVAIQSSFIIVLTLLFTLLLVPKVYAESAAETFYNEIQRPSTRAGSDETFTYTRKEIAEDVNMNFATPDYFNLDANLKNGCAAVAGSVVVGYYDREYDNLIPNYTPTIKRGPVEIYKPVTSDVQNVIQELFIGMNTNQTEPGATEDDFKNGLRNYVNARGYNISFQSRMSGNAPNWSSVKTSLQSNIPLAIFMTPHYLITSLEIGETSTSIMTLQYTANHIMIVHGMMTVNYYNGSYLMRTDRYLKVNSGLSGAAGSYILMDAQATVNDIVCISVY